MLAAAGLKRLGLTDVGVPIPVEILLPAPGQGALGLECRTDDNMTQSVLTTVNNQITFWAVQAERAFTRALERVAAIRRWRRWPCSTTASCTCARQLFSEDGSEMIEEKTVFECGDDDSPRELARRMLEGAPPSIRSLFAAARA